MATGDVVLLAGTDCPPENEEAFIKWYDEVHIPNIFSYAGTKEVTRYRIVNENKDCPRHLVMYRISQDSFQEWLKSPEAAASSVDSKKGEDRFGYKLKWGTRYQVVKEWKK